jgi:hypothetical protein
MLDFTGALRIRERELLSFPQFQSMASVSKPLLILRRYEQITIEDLGPLNTGGEVVRMRNHNSLDSA